MRKSSSVRQIRGVTFTVVVLAEGGLRRYLMPMDRAGVPTVRIWRESALKREMRGAAGGAFVDVGLELGAATPRERRISDDVIARASRYLLLAHHPRV